VTGRGSRRRIPLRARVTITFAALALATTAILASITYALAQTYVVQQRDRLATRQAFLNARLARSLLSGDVPTPDQVVASVTGEAGTQVLLRYEDEWYTSAVSIDPDNLPTQVTAAVKDGTAARQRFSNRGVATLVVGVPLPAANAAYFEVSPMVSLKRTLSILGTSLAVGSIVATLLGGVAGLVVGHRLLRPLKRVSNAAVDIAEGDLDRRLDAEGDGDLEPLVDSFNQMVDGLQLRLEREARFASDVSHELRTPLTALATAAAVVGSRAAEMPPRAATAVGVLTSQIEYFERLVLDLLEISRLDAGAEQLSLEEVDLAAFVEQVSHGLGGPSVVLESPGPWRVSTDTRRLERITSNIFENAARYANGVTRVGLARYGATVQLTIDDDGPGIAPGDRDRVFGRLWRGPGSGTAATRGSGLGLSLVAEHVRLLGGRVVAQDAPNSGARFVVTLPIDPCPT
jgi:signal transduction histidine kinase